jgi:SAM-dependent methyltransferase
VRPDDVVLDVGAGFCEFINHIVSRRRIAVDPGPETARRAAPGVEVVAGLATDLSPVADATVDVVFASNVFEHLGGKGDLLASLAEIRRVLRPGGRLLILQPNIRLVGGAYWDFFDHHLPLTERSLAEALLLADLRPVETRVRFLPYTTKGRLPAHPWLVRLYLWLRPAQWLLGRQTWMVAEKGAGGPAS